MNDATMSDATVRPGSIRTSEPAGQAAEYPELGLRANDDCNMIRVRHRPDVEKWFVSELDAASRGEGDTNPWRFVGAVHRLRVQQLRDRAWVDLAKAETAADKVACQMRIDYLGKVDGMFEAQSFLPIVDPRVAAARRELLRLSCERNAADQLARWQ